MLIVVVTGGRDFNDRLFVYDALDNLHAAHGIEKLIQGGARGFDRLCREWAVSRNVPFTQVNADWNTHGKRAGFLRNIDMIENYGANYGVAGPGGRGTAHAKSHMLKVGLPVWAIRA